MTARLVGWMRDTGRFDAGIGAVARLGATSDNDVVIRMDGVSRTHATLIAQPDGYWIEDAGSKNGTWLNGVRVTRARLRHLDVITLGRFAEFIFVERAAEAPAAEPAEQGLHARLEWLDGPDRGAIVDLPRGEAIIGRAESCGIVIDSAEVSRAHARLTVAADAITLEDLGSVNGTSVDGRPLTRPIALDTGAEIDVGKARRFRLLVDGTPSKSPAAPTDGTTPIGAQDMEWFTRLVWSESDLAELNASVERAASSRPSAPPALPAPSAPSIPSPSPPSPPSVPVAAPAPVPQAGPATVIARADRTQLVKPSLGAAPDVLKKRLPVDEAATSGPKELELPKRFEPPPTPGVDATQLGESPLGRIPKLDAEPGPTSATSTPSGEGATAVPTTNLRSPRERTALPPSTVLGYRDVPPATRATTSGLTTSPAATRFSPGPEEPTPPPIPPETTMAAIESVRLSGDLGVFVIPRGSATIGRATDATVRIDSREMSRVHAVMTVTDHDVIVEDRGSINGTSVNGTAISGRRALVHGDRVCFADFEFRLEVIQTEGNQ